VSVSSLIGSKELNIPRADGYPVALAFSHPFLLSPALLLLLRGPHLRTGYLASSGSIYPPDGSWKPSASDWLSPSESPSLERSAVRIGTCYRKSSVSFYPSRQVKVHQPTVSWLSTLFLPVYRGEKSSPNNPKSKGFVIEAGVTL
jgi:hypothetical protein